MATDIPHFIGGKRVPGRSGRSTPVYNPATGEVSGQAPLASAEEVAEAATAHAAFPGWAGTAPLRRARILNRFLALLERDAARIAAAITAEHGKVLSDAHGELTRGMEVVEFATGAPNLLKARSPRTSAPAWTATRCASRWAWWPASRRSIFLPWCRCGCSP